MAEAVLRIVHAGPHVTVQDGGRPGLMRFGVPASGPMDRGAAAVANAAIGNPPDAPVIEVSLAGLTAECEGGPLTMAVAGGGFIVALDGKLFGSWQVLTLRAGQRLVIRPGPWGSWTYLAVTGRLQVPEWLGSAATHGPSGLGGGRLAAGQRLVVDDPRILPDRVISCPVWARPRHLVRAVLGPQDRYFTPASIRAFQDEIFHLTGAYDRMGVRLRGPSLELAGALSIPSAPVLRGSVQVAGDGVATVLLADHQTTGGYPRIATVLSCDLDGFAQCRSGQAVRFRLITSAQALGAARIHARAVAMVLDGLRRGQQDAAQTRDQHHRP